MTLRLEALCSRIGYRFADQRLIEQALTHRSASRENNERLEYLGDALLGFVIGDALYRRFPAADEGQLSRMRASLVRKESLARLAAGLDVGKHLLLGEGEKRSGGSGRDSTLSNAMEAIMGAIYVDGGYQQASRFVLAIYQADLRAVSPDSVVKDPKTELQELLQSKRFPLPTYEVVLLKGEPHQQVFVVKCRGEGIPLSVEAQGTSRRRAEQAAAFKALELLRAPL